MGISEAELLAMKMRLEKGRKTPVPEDAVKLEKELHVKIMQYCDERRWPYIHSRMDQKSTQAKGVCDFVILATGGRTFYIECKSKSGKLRPEQLAFRIAAEMNCHHVHEVRSMSEFLEIVLS